jgi:acetone carboxylase gamma subunit
MKLSDIYHYFYEELTEQEKEKIPEIFSDLRNNFNFRQFLREARATAVEEKLYGNSTDIINNGELRPFYITNFGSFELYNKNYKLFTATPENLQSYERIFYVSSCGFQFDGSILSHSHGDFGFSYKLMVYFSPGTVKDILQRFDQYHKKNPPCTNKLYCAFAFDFRDYEHPLLPKNLSEEYLIAWQQIIAENNMPDVLGLFSIAPEINVILGKPPKTFEQIKNAYLKIVSDDSKDNKSPFELTKFQSFQNTHSDALYAKYILFKKAKSQSLQLEFINTITEESLRKFTGNLYRLEMLLNNMHPENVNRFFEKLSAKHVAELITDPRYLPEVLKKIPPKCMIFFLINIIGAEKIKELNSTLAYLQYIFQAMQAKGGHDLSELLLNFPLQAISSYFDENEIRVSNFKWMIALIEEQQRRLFIEVVINKKRLRRKFNSTEDLLDLLELLPRNERLFFIKNNYFSEQLKEMRNDQRQWQQVKNLLCSNKDRNDFKTYVFNPEELHNMQILKNIKNEIILEAPQHGFFSSKTSTQVGSTRITVDTGPVSEQILILNLYRERKITVGDAVAKIKEIGKNACVNSDKINAVIASYFFNKTSYQKYIEKFSSEDTFESAFCPIN